MNTNTICDILKVIVFTFLFDEIIFLTKIVNHSDLCAGLIIFCAFYFKERNDLVSTDGFILNIIEIHYFPPKHTEVNITMFAVCNYSTIQQEHKFRR